MKPMCSNVTLIRNLNLTHSEECQERLRVYGRLRGRYENLEQALGSHRRILWLGFTFSSEGRKCFTCKRVV
ncbi:unnamed protein product [Allacma fusca]|uniref:Uncharacterized protein n=1 Tax=Allacma fusca TaxID=39272 RepID=A0A8J2KBR0_9HEXA|nr:unnamed protein product [Allacma fusca]